MSFNIQELNCSVSGQTKLAQKFHQNNRIVNVPQISDVRPIESLEELKVKFLNDPFNQEEAPREEDKIVERVVKTKKKKIGGLNIIA